MQKFTIFTVILTIIIVVVVSEIVLNEYLPALEKNEESFSLDLPDSLDSSKAIQTNVLGADFDLNAEKIKRNNLDMDSELISTELSTSDSNISSVIAAVLPSSEVLPSSAVLPSSNILPSSNVLPSSDSWPLASPNQTPSALPDFEDENFIPITANVYLRDEQIKSAGFAGAYLEREAHNDYLFKTIYIGDIYDAEITKYMIRTNDSIMAKAYVFKIGYKTDVDAVYNYLKERVGQAVNMITNETNEYGYSSFYMNDEKRTDTAFLTVRIGGLLYSFSYPKEYHSQIKNLIKLIEWDLS